MSVSFSVLTPTGRRQIVKATPNSTILQVLEEVCQKQKLDASEYDLRHHSRILDPSSVVRFSQLPNNAQIEMVPAKKKREESPVNIMLQLEDGTRLNGDFLPGCSLNEVILNLCSPEISSVEFPAIIYMRKEITGHEELSKTTLKELGLTSGRALLRFLNRSKEQLGQQLHVSNPLKPTKTENKPSTSSATTSEAVQHDRTSEPIESKERSSCSNEPLKSPEVPTESMDCEVSTPSTSSVFDDRCDLKDAENRQALKRVSGEEIRNGSGSMDCSVNAYDSVPSEKKPCKSFEIDELEPELEIDVSNIEFLGEREALLFNVSDHKSSKIKDDTLPEEFFDLTLEDARSLMRDYKRVREEMENAVLSTKAMKDLSDSRRVLAHLNKYHQTVVRIHFPDRFVLQGVFRPMEKIQHVMSFVKPFLANSDSPFYFYTAPPKTILNPSDTLVEADCVPAAVVYFGSSDQSGPFIKENFILKAVEPNVATHFANKSRKSKNNDKIINDEDTESNQTDYEMECQPGPSNGNRSNSSYKVNSFQTNRTTNSKPSSTVPKWFKPL